MSRRKLTAEKRTAVIALVEEGLTLKDAAGRAGVSEGSLRNWLTKGRKGGPPEYREFATAVDRARMKDGRPEVREGEVPDTETPGSEEDLRIVTWKAAKGGSVQAMKLYWEMLRSKDRDEQPQDPFAALDGPVDLRVIRERKAANL